MYVQLRFPGEPVCRSCIFDWHAPTQSRIGATTREYTVEQDTPGSKSWRFVGNNKQQQNEKPLPSEIFWQIPGCCVTRGESDSQKDPLTSGENSDVIIFFSAFSCATRLLSGVYRRVVVQAVGSPRSRLVLPKGLKRFQSSL